MSRQLFKDQSTVTDEVVYIPFVEDGKVGYRLEWPNGKTSYLILNPSSETDDGQPNVFVYESRTPDVNDGAPLVYVDVDKGIAA